ncbi:MAG: tRNA pseudouridine(55) synthase TruB [Betaproteobacteria bacterium]|nr:tRNA pseudouridine(55) synthase TruB [Betaproteobacteria bacterium]
MKKAPRSRVDGVLLLDKPTGFTSNAAIQRVKRLFNAAKAGHVGTLDPLASGLLPVCLGEATKFSTDTFSADKSYTADVLLGVTTTTGDTEGEVTSRQTVAVTQDQIVAVLSRFTGALLQTPPMYSALKRDGKPLYAYARAGETVERVPRSITIYAIELLEFAADQFRIDVRCSKGTYIRVLAEDIGAALGCGATLAGLRRTSVGGFGLQHAVTLAELEGLPETLRTGKLMPVDCLVSGLPAIVLPADALARIQQGQVAQVGAPAGETAVLARLYDQERRFVGLGELQASGRLQPKRLLATPQARHSGDIQQMPKIA